MVTVTTRAGKGEALTWDEVDENFTVLADNVIEGITPAGQDMITAADTAAQRALLGQGRSAAVTLSGLGSRDFADIPLSAEEVTLHIHQVSTSSTTVPYVLLGDAGGFETTGYVGSISVATSNNSQGNFSTQINLATSWSAAATFQGHITFKLLNPATNLWTFTGQLGRSDETFQHFIAGSKPLSQPLTQIRLHAGAGTFDGNSAAAIVWK